MIEPTRAREHSAGTRAAVTRESRSRIWMAAQIVVGLGLLVGILWQLEWHRVLAILAGASWAWIAGAVAMQAVGKAAWAYRWREVLHAFGIHRGLGVLTVLVLVGLFFSSFLPGGIGGDVVRGYYASEDRKGLLTSYSVVLLERLLGVTSLAALGLASGVVLVLLGGGGYPRPLLWALMAGAAALVVLGTVAFLWRGWDRVLGWTSVLGDRVQGIVTGLAEGRDLFRREAVRTVHVLLSSVLMQVAKVLFAFCCARAVGLEVSLFLLFLIVPAALVVAMVPITLNGLGLREGSMVGLLVAGGADPDLAGGFVLLYLAVSLGFAALGGLLYAGQRWLPLDLSGMTGGDRPASGLADR